jgi:hypothetical protein
MTEADRKVIVGVCDTQDVLSYGIPCVHSTQWLALGATSFTIPHQRPPSEHFDDRSVMCTASLAQEHYLVLVYVHIKSIHGLDRDWGASAGEELDGTPLQPSGR